MGRICSMHVGNEKCTQNFLQKFRGRDHLRELGVDGMIILKLILGYENVSGIKHAQGSVQGVDFCEHGDEL